MKELDKGQKIILGVLLGTAALIMVTQVALFVAYRKKGAAVINAAPPSSGPTA